MIYGLILAVGKGSRLYPLSRSEKPKQFLRVINNKSFLVNTVDRITTLIEKNNIFTEPMNKETSIYNCLY